MHVVMVGESKRTWHLSLSVVRLANRREAAGLNTGLAPWRVRKLTRAAFCSTDGACGVPPVAVPPMSRRQYALLHNYGNCQQYINMITGHLVNMHNSRSLQYDVRSVSNYPQ